MPQRRDELSSKSRHVRSPQVFGAQLPHRPRRAGARRGGQKRRQEQTGTWRDLLLLLLLLRTGLRPPAHFPRSPRAAEGSRSTNPFLPVSLPAPISGWQRGNGRHGQSGAAPPRSSGDADPACGQGAPKRRTFTTEVRSPPTKRPADNLSA